MEKIIAADNTSMDAACMIEKPLQHESIIHNEQHQKISNNETIINEVEEQEIFNKETIINEVQEQNISQIISIDETTKNSSEKDLCINEQLAQVPSTKDSEECLEDSIDSINLNLTEEIEVTVQPSESLVESDNVTEEKTFSEQALPVAESFNDVQEVANTAEDISDVNELLTIAEEPSSATVDETSNIVGEEVLNAVPEVSSNDVTEVLPNVTMEAATTVINEELSLVVAEEHTNVVLEKPSLVAAEEYTNVVYEKPPSLVIAEEHTNAVHEKSSLVAEEHTNAVHEKPSLLVAEEHTNAVHEKPPLVAEEHTNVAHEKTSLVVAEEHTNVVHEKPSIVAEEHTNVVNEKPSGIITEEPTNITQEEHTDDTAEGASNVPAEEPSSFMEETSSLAEESGNTVSEETSSVAAEETLQNSVCAKQPEVSTEETKNGVDENGAPEIDDNAAMEVEEQVIHKEVSAQQMEVTEIDKAENENILPENEHAINDSAISKLQNDSDIAVDGKATLENDSEKQRVIKETSQEDTSIISPADVKNSHIVESSDGGDAFIINGLTQSVTDEPETTPTQLEELEKPQQTSDDVKTENPVSEAPEPVLKVSNVTKSYSRKRRSEDEEIPEASEAEETAADDNNVPADETIETPPAKVTKVSKRGAAAGRMQVASVTSTPLLSKSSRIIKKKVIWDPADGPPQSPLKPTAASPHAAKPSQKRTVATIKPDAELEPPPKKAKVLLKRGNLPQKASVALNTAAAKLKKKTASVKVVEQCSPPKAKMQMRQKVEEAATSSKATPAKTDVAPKRPPPSAAKGPKKYKTEIDKLFMDEGAANMLCSVKRAETKSGLPKKRKSVSSADKTSVIHSPAKGRKKKDPAQAKPATPAVLRKSLKKEKPPAKAAKPVKTKTPTKTVASTKRSPPSSGKGRRKYKTEIDKLFMDEGAANMLHSMNQQETPKRGAKTPKSVSVTNKNKTKKSDSKSKGGKLQKRYHFPK